MLQAEGNSMINALAKKFKNERKNSKIPQSPIIVKSTKPPTLICGTVVKLSKKPANVNVGAPVIVLIRLIIKSIENTKNKMLKIKLFLLLTIYHL